MIYVLSGSKERTDAWRLDRRLPRSHVYHIGDPAILRGKYLEHHEIVMLESFHDRPYSYQEKVWRNLGPTNVVWDKIPVVG